MTIMQPVKRIEYAEREVDRYKGDVQDWKRAHDDLAERCWPWEDLAGKANLIFGQILKLDNDVQADVLTGLIEFDPEMDQRITKVLEEWLKVSCEVFPHLAQLKQEFGHVDGADEMRRNIRQATAILTPDANYFQGDELVRLRDEAVEAYQTGQTEPLFGDGGTR